MAKLDLMRAFQTHPTRNGALHSNGGKYDGGEIKKWLLLFKNVTGQMATQFKVTTANYSFKSIGVLPCIEVLMNVTTVTRSS